MRSQTPTRRFTSDSEEDEFDDTLLAQLDALLATAEPTSKPMTPEDKFFDEITELLNETDRQSSLPVINKSSSGEFDADNFFDQILHEIPKNERPRVHWHDDISSETLNKEIDELENELAKIDAKIYRDKLRAAFIQKVKLEIVEPEHMYEGLLHRKGLAQQRVLDEKRLIQHLKSMTTLIQQLKPWSPAKNQYNKIINNRTLSTHEKAQQLIWIANAIVQMNAQKKKGFLIERLTRKSNAIHAAIAAIDLSDEKTPILTVETLRKM